MLFCGSLNTQNLFSAGVLPRPDPQGEVTRLPSLLGEGYCMQLVTGRQFDIIASHVPASSAPDGQLPSDLLSYCPLCWPNDLALTTAPRFPLRTAPDHFA